MAPVLAVSEGNLKSALRRRGREDLKEEFSGRRHRRVRPRALAQSDNILRGAVACQESVRFAKWVLQLRWDKAAWDLL